MHDFVDHPLWRRRLLRHLPERPTLPWRFVIEEKAGERFLNALSALIRIGDRSLPETLDLPSGDFVGSSTEGDALIASRDGVSYDYALFRDGLALLGGPPPRRVAGHRIWDQGTDSSKSRLPNERRAICLRMLGSQTFNFQANPIHG